MAIFLFTTGTSIEVDLGQFILKQIMLLAGGTFSSTLIFLCIITCYLIEHAAKYSKFETLNNV